MRQDLEEVIPLKANFSRDIVFCVEIDRRNTGKAMLHQKSLQGRERKIIRFVGTWLGSYVGDPGVPFQRRKVLL